MTYCLGWKTKDSVFIAADSAVTIPSALEPSTSLSSFGEISYRDNINHVYEGLLKICIVDRAIVAFSGCVQTAITVIKTFQEIVKVDPNILEGFKRAVLSSGPYKENNDIALILGYYGKDGPILISYNHDGKRTFNDHDQCVQIGSVGSIYRVSSEIVIKTFLQGNLGDEHMLAAVTAVLQSYGMFDQMMKMNVGGVFFGASSDSNGVSWQRDTSYFLYPPNLSISHFISVYSIDNALGIASSFVSPKVLMNTINTGDVKEWQGRWMPELKEKLNSGKSIFYTFLSMKNRLITVIKKTDNSTDRFFKIQAELSDGKEKYTFSFSSELVELLNYAKPNGDEFRFNWRND